MTLVVPGSLQNMESRKLNLDAFCEDSCISTYILVYIHIHIYIYMCDWLRIDVDKYPLNDSNPLLNARLFYSTQMHIFVM